MARTRGGAKTTKDAEQPPAVTAVPKTPRHRQNLSEDPSTEPSLQLLTYDQVRQHNTQDDCWIVVNGKAYDVTDFMPDHPGGSAVVLEASGQDSTDEFTAAHPEAIMKLTLGPAGLLKAFRGDVDSSTMPHEKPSKEKASGHTAAPKKLSDLGPNECPPIEAILNLHDLAAVAQRVMVATGKKHAWDYYSSGADDELTYNENVNAFQRIWLKPRILVNVASIDTSCKILGHASSFPVYLSAVAMCGMGHEQGEISWVKGAASSDVLFMVPNLSSKPFEDILAARAPGQVVFLQIYVNPDREVVLEQIRACERHGVKALCITVDSAVAGKRERDLRNKIEMQLGRASQQTAAAKGTKARKAGSYANRDPALNWEDVAWFRAQTDIPVVIKGVQTAEDAVLAAKAGARAVILSNHGGRNCDTSRSGIEVLPEVVAALKEEGLRGPRAREGEMEVWVDGGVRRGTDIIKAVAMGADAVGLGKPAVFAMSAYGEDGIAKMLDILKSELVTVMRLCGAPTLADLNPRLVNATSLERHADCAPIPPSPYVIEKPEKGVRDPTFPELPHEREKVMEQIAKLQAHLGTLQGKKRHHVAASVLLLGKLLRIMFMSLMCTVFATSNSGSLHRSALFLIVFLVVHMLGNLTALFGRDAYNTYGHHVNSMPLIRLIEAYLLCGTLVHLFTASYFSWNKRRAIARSPRTTGLLALSGTVLLAFLVLHLRAFRFSPSTRRWRHADSPPASPTDRDLYILMLELFADPQQVVFYIASVAAVAVHLHRGWQKTVLKMDDLDKSERAPIIALGHALIYPLCAGFALIPAWMYAVQQPQFASQVLGRSLAESAAAVHNATGGVPVPHPPFFFFLPSYFVKQQ